VVGGSQGILVGLARIVGNKGPGNEKWFGKMKKVLAISIKTTKNPLIRSRSFTNPCGCGRHLYILRLTPKLLQTTSAELLDVF
jgi:hypothetical protein